MIIRGIPSQEQLLLLGNFNAREGSTLFSIFFPVMLKHAFEISTDGVYLHTRLDGRLFSLSQLREKSKVCEVLIRDDAALAMHSEEQLQCLMDSFARAHQDFSLTISLNKTNVLGQGDECPPAITINKYELEVVPEFTYLGSIITDSLSLDSEISR
ncbi:hypothetical protein chiPu_0000762 [Chiloscyllium punctatum]|uniref:Reverse transcriptase domain-containing protein n=1 Tax=Chiloscyllium punctatum TaxID=137246 RepID=A0A401RW54_CHIPU|nr:hypothetical protein [Chiloscyllium punctatum]